jgi:predicted deacylase
LHILLSPVIASGREAGGPTMLLTANIHGNEVRQGSADFLTRPHQLQCIHGTASNSPTFHH